MEKCRIFHRIRDRSVKVDRNPIDQSERIRSNRDESYYINRLRNIHSLSHVPHT